jgi:alkylhydroperoxidase/carboxymuconolactone decarboxylase family protein YurZ
MNTFDPSSLSLVIGAKDRDSQTPTFAPGMQESAADFWKAAYESPLLTLRMKELILVALHASVTSVNHEAVLRHVNRAIDAGASGEDILDVLISIVGLANHALYFAVPILIEELERSGKMTSWEMPPMRDDISAIKDDFLKTRGFWNSDRDPIARLMPDYFKVLSRLSMEPWKSGVLAPKEREFIYIAIDASVTHMHEDGLRKHIQNALKQGATRDEILEVFQLVSLLGIESYILGVQAISNRH